MNRIVWMLISALFGLPAVGSATRDQDPNP